MGTDLFKELKLNPGGLRSIFTITWIFVLAGSLAGISLLLVSELFGAKSFAGQFLQKGALFTFFAFMLAAYTGVCVTSDTGGGGFVSIKASLRGAAGKSFLTVGLVFSAALLYSVIILVQTGVSAAALIPFAGPALIALVTAPLFIFNLILAAAVLCLMAVLPPAVSSCSSLKETFACLRDLLKNQWMKISIYLLISIPLFVAAAVGISLLVNYSAGITKALQWKINTAYSPTLNAVSGSGIFTRLIAEITPGADPVSAFREYGSDLINYLRILKFTIGISYIAAFTFVVSLPLSIYFYFSAVFFKNLINNKTDI